MGLQPFIMTTTGLRGIGKSHNNYYVEAVNTANPIQEKGKQPQKVLIFDVQNEYGSKFGVKAIRAEHVYLMQPGNIARVIPFHEDGAEMTMKEKKAMLAQLVHIYRDGLFILEDIDNYFAHGNSQEFISGIISNRHKGQSMIFSHQSMSKVTTTEWENVDFVRMHYQMDSTEKLLERSPNHYDKLTIAKNIIDMQYEIGNEHYCLYVDMKKHKIKGNYDKNAYLIAVERFLDENYQQISRLMKMGGGRKYDERGARVKLLADKMKYYGGI